MPCNKVIARKLGLLSAVESALAPPALAPTCILDCNLTVQILRVVLAVLMKQSFNHPTAMINAIVVSLFLPPAYVVRGKVMFWHASVHPSICLSTGGVPISHNALQHFPECHEAAGGGGYPPGGYPGQVPPLGGVTRVRYPPGGVLPGSGIPPGGGFTRVRYPPTPGGYPGRTTEGVLTTRRAVCLLRSRRRTFLLPDIFTLCLELPASLKDFFSRSILFRTLNVGFYLDPPKKELNSTLLV